MSYMVPGVVCELTRDGLSSDRRDVRDGSQLCAFMKILAVLFTRAHAEPSTRRQRRRLIEPSSTAHARVVESSEPRRRPPRPPHAPEPAAAHGSGHLGRGTCDAPGGHGARGSARRRRSAGAEPGGTGPGRGARGSGRGGVSLGPGLPASWTLQRGRATPGRPHLSARSSALGRGSPHLSHPVLTLARRHIGRLDGRRRPALALEDHLLETLPRVHRRLSAAATVRSFGCCHRHRSGHVGCRRCRRCCHLPRRSVASLCKLCSRHDHRPDGPLHRCDGQPGAPVALHPRAVELAAPPLWDGAGTQAAVATRGPAPSLAIVAHAARAARVSLRHSLSPTRGRCHPPEGVHTRATIRGGAPSLTPSSAPPLWTAHRLRGGGAPTPHPGPPTRARTPA